MESGTILHLALLRKISNLSSNPNYRQKFYQLPKPKPTENDHSTPSLCSFKKHAEFPLIEISNRQDNHSAQSHKQPHRKRMFEDQNTTISGWSVSGVEEPEFGKQLRYKFDQAKVSKIAKLEEGAVRRKNNSLGNHLGNQNSINLSDYNQPSNPKPLPSKRQHLHSLASRHKYSLIKQVNINYHHDGQLPKKQSKQKLPFAITQKLTSFEAFVAQVKLRNRTYKD